MKLQIAADTWVWAVFALYLVLLYYPTIREIIGIGYLVDKGQQREFVREVEKVYNAGARIPEDPHPTAGGYYAT